MTSSAADANQHDLAIVLIAPDDAANLAFLLPEVTSITLALGIRAEAIVVCGGEGEEAASVARAHGARVVRPSRPGYGAAFLEGCAASRAPFILTLDVDLTRTPTVIRDLWAARDRADLVVGSRYLPGGSSETPWIRQVLSRFLNAACSSALSIQIHDVSSGCRLHRRRVLDGLTFGSSDFGLLPEVLVRLHAEGYRVAEVPFQFASRATWRAQVKPARVAWSYLLTLSRMWRLRNSIRAADYDHRAFDSAIPLQRYWQRARHRIICGFAAQGGRILDVGCGSSRILPDLSNAVGVDVLLRKLRFLHRVHPQVAQASVNALPFPDASFDTVICSEVIEHIPDEPSVLGELTRVLRPGGTLVLGTPDYGRVLWHIIEWAYGKVAPGGYAHEHITHFDREGLVARLTAGGYGQIECAYVGFCEMILKTTKSAAGEPRVNG